MRLQYYPEKNFFLSEWVDYLYRVQIPQFITVIISCTIQLCIKDHPVSSDSIVWLGLELVYFHSTY